jgi:hypothetical protein
MVAEDTLVSSVEAVVISPPDQTGIDDSKVPLSNVGLVSNETSEDAASLTTSKSDEDLLKEAVELRKEEAYLLAYKVLLQVKDKSLLQFEHKEIMRMALLVKEVYATLNGMHPEQEGWIQQNESHGRRDTAIYYKLDNMKLTCRIETPIEQSLLLPLLSVMNESNLYSSWMPSYKFPRLGIEVSECLREYGHGNQIIRFMVQLPYFIANRECFLHAFAVDSIDEDHAIIIKLMTLDPGPYQPDFTVPEPSKGVVRVDMENGMLIRVCPHDHFLLQKSHANYSDEHVFLFSMYLTADSHMSTVPVSFINFITRTVIGRAWGMMLSVAEDIRDGKRPEYADLMREKADQYGWIEKRLDALFANVDAKYGVKGDQAKNESDYQQST